MDRKQELEDAMLEPWEKLKASAFPSKEWRARNKAAARVLELFKRVPYRDAAEALWGESALG